MTQAVTPAVTPRSRRAPEVGSSPALHPGPNPGPAAALNSGGRLRFVTHRSSRRTRHLGCNLGCNPGPNSGPSPGPTPRPQPRPYTGYTESAAQPELRYASVVVPTRTLAEVVDPGPRAGPKPGPKQRPEPSPCTGYQPRRMPELRYASIVVPSRVLAELVETPRSPPVKPRSVEPGERSCAVAGS